MRRSGGSRISSSDWSSSRCLFRSKLASRSSLPAHRSCPPDATTSSPAASQTEIDTSIHVVEIGPGEEGKDPDGMPGSLLDRNRFHFFEGRQALQALLDAVLHEGRHPVFDGGF